MVQTQKLGDCGGVAIGVTFRLIPGSDSDCQDLEESDELEDGYYHRLAFSLAYTTDVGYTLQIRSLAFAF